MQFSTRFKEMQNIEDGNDCGKEMWNFGGDGT